MQLRRDIASHRQTVTAFAAFWLVLLLVTALIWQRGMPGWLFLIHLLLLPTLAGIATGTFRLNSGLAGLVVSEIDLFIVNAVPMASLSVLPNPPMPAEPLFTGSAGVFEVLEFVVLMGIPGYLLGLVGGAIGRRLSSRQRTA